jgi:hypothetical protein
MNDIFSFLLDFGTHEERKVDNFQGENGLEVDTCYVSDSEKPYETAVRHKNYNDWKWIIVEMYDTKKLAQDGHDKWVKIMTSVKLPTQIEDVSRCGIIKLAEKIGIDMTKICERGSND